MSSLNVYYDGTNLIPLEKINIEPNQKISITINKTSAKKKIQKSNGKILSELFSNNQISVFSDIENPIAWQKQQRDEWQ